MYQNQNLNRAKIIKLVEKTKENLHNTEFGNNAGIWLLNLRQQKEKTDKLNFIKMKKIVHQQTLSHGWEENLQNGRKYWQIIYLIRD